MSKVEKQQVELLGDLEKATSELQGVIWMLKCYNGIVFV